LILRIIQSNLTEKIFTWDLTGNAAAEAGQFGDYVGGVAGTFLALITAGLLFFTWLSSRKQDERGSISSILAQMLKTHDDIIQRKVDFSTEFLKEFSHIYRITQKIQPDYDTWDWQTRVDISYTYCLFGLSSGALHALRKYDRFLVKAVHDDMARRRDRGANNIKSWYKGRQSYLPHYMRNLFSMFSLVKTSHLSLKDKLRFAKVIRSKMSNLDQAVLSLNIISHFGKEWEDDGLVQLFKPFANVPRLFFGLDPNINLQDRFPMVQFEWQKQLSPRLVYKYRKIGAFHVVTYRDWAVPD
jgi:hypothetical protein